MRVSPAPGRWREPPGAPEEHARGHAGRPRIELLANIEQPSGGRRGARAPSASACSAANFSWAKRQPAGRRTSSTRPTARRWTACRPARHHPHHRRRAPTKPLDNKAHKDSYLNPPSAAAIRWSLADRPCSWQSAARHPARGGHGKVHLLFHHAGARRRNHRRWPRWRLARASWTPGRVQRARVRSWAP